MREETPTMRWRERKRHEIIGKYRSVLCLGTLSDVPISCSTVLSLGPPCDIAISCSAVYQNKPPTFTILPAKREEQVQFTSVYANESPLGLSHGRISTQSLDLGSFSRAVPLLRAGDIRVITTSLDQFPLLVTRFSFLTLRQERGLLFGKIPEQCPPRRPLPPVKRPPRSPSLQNASLEERLRWILTPPIHELLSDPQLALPENPFPFQTLGIKWLYDRDSALLADEMGLGKTMQAIIAARLLWRAQIISQILVVCPKTLIPTWQTEIRKWWPQVIHNVKLPGSDRQFFLRLGTPNVIIKIINYEALAREAEWLEDQRFSHDLVIIDEAQRIKNPAAQTSKAVKALRAARRWALTGTPLENKVDDLISIFDFVRPTLFEDHLRHRASQLYDTGLTDGTTISEMIGPFLLRRRADEVLDQLPDKSDQDTKIELDPAQRETYDRMEQDGVIELNAKGDTITVTHVFALINKLRQICNFDPLTGASAKLERLLADLEEVSESGRKALIFSQFVEDKYGLKRLAEELQERAWRVLQLHGQIPQNRRQNVIDTFQSDSSVTALLLNFKVGGIGLNLQAANYVFLFDRWWNPAVEDQAVKRVHRIGQTQKVFIRRFYCIDTIEERILTRLAEKRRLFRTVIDAARPEPDSLGLTEEEIFSLFNIKVRPRKSSQKKGPTPVVLDNMDPTQFEVMVAQVYENQGYVLHHSGGSHDAGIDILAEKLTAGARERVVIQCKHQRANVGRPILQQLWGVVSADPSFTRGDLVTSSAFTPEAKQFATGKRLTLVDRDLLSKLVRDFNVARFDSPPA